MVLVCRLSEEELQVLQEWRLDGAESACKTIEETIDMLISENRESSAEDTLRLIRNLRGIKNEISVFKEKGGQS